MKKATLLVSGSVVSHEIETREKDGKVYKNLLVLLFTGEQKNYAVYLPADFDLTFCVDKDNVFTLGGLIPRDYNSAIKQWVVGSRFELPYNAEYKKIK